MSYLYIDIETLPQAEPVEPEAVPVPDLVAIQPASNLRDPVKMAESVHDRRVKAQIDYVKAREAAQSTALDEWRKTSLDPLRGRIASIAWAVNDSQVRVLWSLDNLGAVLDAIAGDLVSPFGIQWVGHNVAGFDLRFLKLHAMRIGHPLAKSIPYAKWDKRVVDTMELAAGPNPASGRVSQASLARFFGLSVATSPGSEVLGLYQSGDCQSILDHNREDVEIVRAIHNKFRGM